MYLNHEVFLTYLNYPIYLTYVIYQSIKSIKSSLISPHPIWHDLHSNQIYSCLTKSNQIWSTVFTFCMHPVCILYAFYVFLWNAQWHPSGGIPCARGAAQPLQGQGKNSITLQHPVPGTAGHRSYTQRGLRSLRSVSPISRSDSCRFMASYLEVILCYLIFLSTKPC